MEVLERPGQKALFFYGQNSYCALWLDEPAQKLLENSAQKYSEQYEKRLLKRSKDGQLERLYAKAAARLEWGSKKDALDRAAPAKAGFGYSVLGKNAYFLISVPSVQSQSSGPSPALQKSEPISLLFTRAQLKPLLLALSAD